MKIRFSRQARADLAEITEAISQDNPRRAETYTDELEAACIALSDMPAAFQIFGRRNGQEIRRKPHGNYVILYRVTTAHIDILRIIHGARDYQRLLRPNAYPPTPQTRITLPSHARPPAGPHASRH